MRIPILWVIFIYWYIMVVAMIRYGEKRDANIGKMKLKRSSIMISLERV